MTQITYLVGKIPIAIALQIMHTLKDQKIPATLMPTDQDTAAIEVALIDRPFLDDLLAPIEAQLRSARTIIDPSMPFADLHDTIVLGRYELGEDSDETSMFTGLLIRYQGVAHDSVRLDMLADDVSRRIARANLPRDLLGAYGALARLARWRAAQLRGGK